MSTETVRERILAEAAARPKVSLAGLDAIIGNPLAEIKEAFEDLVTSGDLVPTRVLGVYELKDAVPNRDTILTMLLNMPRTLDALQSATAWEPSRVAEVVRLLENEGLVERARDGKHVLTERARNRFARELPERGDRARQPHERTVPEAQRAASAQSGEHVQVTRALTRRDIAAHAALPALIAQVNFAGPGATDAIVTATRLAYAIADALEKAR